MPEESAKKSKEIQVGTLSKKLIPIRILWPYLARPSAHLFASLKE